MRLVLCHAQVIVLLGDPGLFENPEMQRWFDAVQREERQPVTRTGSSSASPPPSPRFEEGKEEEEEEQMGLSEAIGSQPDDAHARAVARRARASAMTAAIDEEVVLCGGGPAWSPWNEASTGFDEAERRTEHPIERTRRWLLRQLRDLNRLQFANFF